MSRTSDAIFIPSPNFWENRYGHTPAYIILHGTAGGSSAQGVAQWFQNPASQVSAHYIIGKDGKIVCCVKEYNAAWANGVITDAPTRKHDSWWTFNPNLNTISIEHVKAANDNSEQLTPVQQQASFELIREICFRWRIPIRAADSTGGITGHFSIDPLDRMRCPGAYPWDGLWQYLKETMMIDISNPAIANYYKLAPNSRWECKNNGFLIGGRILEYYRVVGGSELYGLSLLGLPLSNEVPAEKPNTAKQFFERGIVVYDPNHDIDKPPTASGCYLQHLDRLYTMPQQLVSANTQISELQKTLARDEASVKSTASQVSNLSAQLVAAQNKIDALTAQLAQRNAVSGSALGISQQPVYETSQFASVPQSEGVGQTTLVTPAIEEWQKLLGNMDAMETAFPKPIPPTP